jgi:hypothetical protein
MLTGRTAGRDEQGSVHRPVLADGRSPPSLPRGRPKAGRSVLTATTCFQEDGPAIALVSEEASWIRPISPLLIQQGHLDDFQSAHRLLTL